MWPSATSFFNHTPCLGFVLLWAGWLAGLAGWLAGWPSTCRLGRTALVWSGLGRAGRVFRLGSWPGWLAGWLAAWLAGWLTGWLPGAGGRPAGRLAAGWPAGQLADWLLADTKSTQTQTPSRQQTSIDRQVCFQHQPDLWVTMCRIPCMD